MTRYQFSRLFLSLLLLASTLASFLLDWKPNHLLNPEWHPHARFHGGLLLFTLAGLSGTALWLLWRRSLEPFVGIQAATFLLLAYWSPLFYVNALVPGSSLWAGPEGQEPRWAGHIVYPNLLVAGAAVFATLVAMVIARPMRPIEGAGKPAARAH
jgi:hypothetical protein